MTTKPANSFKDIRALGILALFIAIVLGAGTFIGLQSAPGDWYEALRKPPFNPPNWIFAPVWTVLYILIAVAGWRTFVRDPGGPLMKIWYAQMLLNWLWPPLFFVMHLPWAAFAVLVVMLLLILNFTTGSWRKDRPSGWLFLPYALWVGFAGLLNISIALLN